MQLNSLQSIFDYVKRDRYSTTDDEWEESQHPRGQPDNAGQFTSRRLVDNIDIILNGTDKEKEPLKNQFLRLVEKTPAEYKEVGMKGDEICTRYGVIARHKNKDEDHYFSPEEWKQICQNLEDPQKCIITRSQGRKDFNIYTLVNGSVMVGIEIKSPQRDVISNNLKTIFRREPKETETVLYPKDLKKITPAQRSLLSMQRHETYTADRRHIIIIDATPEIVKSIQKMLKAI